MLPCPFSARHGTCVAMYDCGYWHIMQRPLVIFPQGPQCCLFHVLLTMTLEDVVHSPLPQKFCLLRMPYVLRRVRFFG